MRIGRIAVVSLGLVLACGAALSAQAAGTATPAQGFTPQTLIMKLSLYLPEGAAGNAFFGAGQRDQGAAGSQTQGGGTQAQAGAQAGGQSAQRAQRQQLQFTRDEKLFVTKDQITKLLPILQALRENPMPSPTKAKKVETDVDAILTAAQKAEWDRFQKELEKFQQNAQRQAGGNGGQGIGAQAQNFQNMTEQQRQDLLNSLTPEQRQAVQNRMQQGGQQQALTPIQRRQRQLDEFIAALKNRLKEI
jgi:hypothetical protein